MTNTQETRPSKEFKGNATKQGFFELPHHNPFPQEYQLIEKLVKKIKEIMGSKKSRENDDKIQELVMIDAIQRLGLECYFKDDIHAALENCNETGECSENLHDVALRFRLLRQAGYNVQADTFSKFKDNKVGRFKQELEKDTKGLISLFEASELSIPGDQILDEAGEFTWNLLMNSSKNVEKSETSMIRNILSNPCHKTIPRLTAKKQLHNFENLLKFLHDCFGTQEWIKEIQHLARIDINMAQITLKTEITQVSLWWKQLRMAEVLTLARNQPAKWHMRSSVALPSPDQAELRTELTKSISFIYIIDDIFDLYGNLEELTLFTEAVNQWDHTNINGLPDYITICLKALYDTTHEMSQKIYIKHGWNPKVVLQNAWAELCNAFLVEARWFASEYLPTTTEYLTNGVVSSGVYVVFATLFSLLGEATSYESTYIWNNNHPKIVSLAGTLLRLWDDLGSAKDEDQDGHDGSFVACYMNEHQESSDENAREYVLGMISDAWKHLNEECLSQNSPFSSDFKNAFLNLARMIPIMYKYDDNHRLPSLEKHMKSLLYE
ncbi:(3S,6E)-nerolidol synthase 1-like [Spinacia oleracea]|uniref:(3S,6E)-nerolidol synthase 1-like n=1 Tax=Spinacia oleracea TaxID=3562 RepID=A0ABM3QX32_SPIOL|nr:(3S,6E)-nerolidol synthase 1-like [Spinacia oleracea]